MANLQQALLNAKRLCAELHDQNVHGVGIGFKEVGGERTDTPSIVFLVKEKQVNPANYLRLPVAIGGQPTDVQEAPEVEALNLFREFSEDIDPEALDDRRRPVDPGSSIGHVDVTAGTLGAIVTYTPTGEPMLLSNNHVFANVNQASIGDSIVQPGSYDGGEDPADRVARLHSFATIGFGGPVGKPKRRMAALYWRAVRALGNAAPRLTGCPYRVQVGTENVEQPFPNIVDAALAELEPGVEFLGTHRFIGNVSGSRVLALGDIVEKVGRTTEHTFGQVVGTSFAVRVNMGAQGTAQFDDQIRIQGMGETPDFSAGGDSGSVIVHVQSKTIGGLLFAGGGNDTFANTAQNVANILRITF